MSKVKRILSVIMAMVMVLAMSVPTFAATTPTANDTAKGTVQNVEKAATVTAYQITKAQYDGGFTGYVKTDNKLAIADVLAPTSDEVTAIAKQIASAQTTMMPFVVAAVFYFVFNLLVAIVMDKIEKKMNYYR